MNHAHECRERIVGHGANGSEVGLDCMYDNEIKDSNLKRKLKKSIPTPPHYRKKPPSPPYHLPNYLSRPPSPVPRPHPFSPHPLTPSHPNPNPQSPIPNPNLETWYMYIFV